MFALVALLTGAPAHGHWFDKTAAWLPWHGPRAVTQRICALLAVYFAELPQELETRVGERAIRLSGGERERVAIARALYHDPDSIVFDEATAALGLVTEAEVTRAIDGLRGIKTPLVITHRVNTIRGCDRLVWIREGRIEAVGRFDELCARHSDFRALAQRATV